MGKRGPPPKPDSLKKAQGTFRKERTTAGKILELPPGSPPTPELPAEALKIWNQLVPLLLEAGVLAKVDGGILEAYCRTHARAVSLDSEAGKRPVTKTPFGLKVNPAVIEARKLWPIVEKLATDLGLHYAARSRVKPPEQEKPEDKAEEFLFGGPLKVVEGGKKGA
jgi:P27 family predicted phage terminase small subunit